ncbi:O-antigen ligase family protein [Modestobacter versicolor]|uniref:O-antigen ligase family protein n=1 Tax=Modestobacter versicolor TaxID=429133 RepID=UPI0034DE7410
MRFAGAGPSSSGWSRLGAVAAAVTVVPAVVRRPQNGLLALAALTPFDGLLQLVPRGGLLAGWKEALLLLTLAVAVVRGRRDASSLQGRHLPWWPALVALVVAGSVSALVTAGLLGVLAIKITFFWTLALAVLWCAPLTASDRDRLVSVLMGVGVVTALVGLAQQAVGAQFLVDLGYRYNEEVRFAGGYLRSFSTFVQPFPFALYLVLCLLVGGAVALAEPRRTRNALFLLATPLLVVGMATSIVRAGALALVVGVVWLVVLRDWRWLWAVAAAGVSGVVALVFLSSEGAVGAALSPTSLLQRTSSWSQALTDIAGAPFGHGLGTSGSAAQRIATAAGDIAPTDQPDNYYVKVLLELGPLGLWLFVLLLVSALWWTARLSRSLTGRDAALALGVSASVASVVASSVVATYFEIFPLDYYFWVLLGGVACAAAQADRGGTSGEPSPAASLVTAPSSPA